MKMWFFEEQWVEINGKTYKRFTDDGQRHQSVPKRVTSICMMPGCGNKLGWWKDCCSDCGYLVCNDCYKEVHYPHHIPNRWYVYNRAYRRSDDIVTLCPLCQGIADFNFSKYPYNEIYPYNKIKIAADLCTENPYGTILPYVQRKLKEIIPKEKPQSYLQQSFLLLHTKLHPPEDYSQKLYPPKNHEQQIREIMGSISPFGGCSVPKETSKLVREDIKKLYQSIKKEYSDPRYNNFPHCEEYNPFPPPSNVKKSTLDQKQKKREEKLNLDCTLALLLSKAYSYPSYRSYEDLSLYFEDMGSYKNPLSFYNINIGNIYQELKQNLKEITCNASRNALLEKHALNRIIAEYNTIKVKKREKMGWRSNTSKNYNENTTTLDQIIENACAQKRLVKETSTFQAVKAFMGDTPVECTPDKMKKQIIQKASKDFLLSINTMEIELPKDITNLLGKFSNIPT